MTAGEPGHPGHPGEPGQPGGVGGAGGTGGEGGRGGTSREQFMTRGARYSVVFLFVLTVALASANLLWTSSQVGQIRQAAASTVQLCQSGNEARAQQVQLWTFLIHISRPPPHQTAQEKAQRAATIRRFEDYVHKVFMPRNCQRFH